jgi:hypothetical protein
VLVFIRQILEVGANRLLTLEAAIGEHRFVALDTERIVIPENVPLGGQGVGTVEAIQRLTFQYKMLHLR